MIFRNSTIVMVVFAATLALSQSAQPASTAAAPIPNRPPMMERRNPGTKRPVDLQSAAALREQVGDMEKTLSKMHVALKRMYADTAKSKGADPLTKANLEMWELMTGHLDKELEQLRLALASREDMETRRAALYKQADANAAAQAQAWRAAQAARFAQSAQGASGTESQAPSAPTADQNHPSQTEPAQPSSTLTPNNSGPSNR